MIMKGSEEEGEEEEGEEEEEVGQSSPVTPCSFLSYPIPFENEGMIQTTKCWS